MTEEKAIHVDDIALDEDWCQARMALDLATVDTYADLYEDDVDLGPLDVFEVDGVLYLVDGWHRLKACEQLNKGFVRVRIVGSSNDMEDATKAALSANHKHGLRRTRADKRRCVRLALEAELYEDLDSNRAMARDLGVSHTFVSEQRKKWEAERSGNVATDPDMEPDAVDVSSVNGVQPEQKPKKAKPSPFEAFKKNVEHIRRDLPNFYEHGSEVYEAAERFVKLVRAHEPDVAEVA